MEPTDTCYIVKTCKQWQLKWFFRAGASSYLVVRPTSVEIMRPENYCFHSKRFLCDSVLSKKRWPFSAIHSKRCPVSSALSATAQLWNVLQHLSQCNSTRVKILGNSTRVTLRNDRSSTRVTFFTEWFDSSHNQWLETRFRVIFTKSPSPWLTNLVRLLTKKWAFFASVMITIGANLLFCLLPLVVLWYTLRIKCST